MKDISTSYTKPYTSRAPPSVDTVSEELVGLPRVDRLLLTGPASRDLLPHPHTNSGILRSPLD